MFLVGTSARATALHLSTGFPNFGAGSFSLKAWDPLYTSLHSASAPSIRTHPRAHQEGQSPSCTEVSLKPPRSCHFHDPRQVCAPDPRRPKICSQVILHLSLGREGAGIVEKNIAYTTPCQNILLNYDRQPQVQDFKSPPLF